jgi:hypothetical protein
MSTTLDRAPARDLVAETRAEPSRPRLLQPSRGYAVTHNPFAVWEVLPLLTLSFAALAIAMLHISSAYLATVAVGGFLVLTLGTLLVPAVTLKGSLSITHEGIAFERGGEHLTASWSDVRGVVNRRDCGLTLVLRDPEQTRRRIRTPGGLCAEGGEARIPLRMFGDRQFSILYDIRDRLPEAAWKDALAAASRRSTARIVLVYSGVVAVSCLAMWSVLNLVS